MSPYGIVLNMNMRLTVFLLCSCFFYSDITMGSESECKYSGQELSQKQLDKIIIDHDEWLDYAVSTLIDIPVIGLEDSYGRLGIIELPNKKKNGERVESGEDLSTTDKLWIENSQSEFFELFDSVFNDNRRANICGSVLHNIDLSGADLSRANLSRVKFKNTNLKNTDLRSANLTKSNFFKTDISKAKLARANLSGFMFTGVRYSKGNPAQINTNYVNLSNLNLTGTNFYKSWLKYVDFSNSILIEANLSETHLNHANLSNTNLQKANLAHANMSDVNLYNSDLTDSDLRYALYQPESMKLPKISSIASANNLFSLTYSNNPQGLIELRNGFKEAGFRKAEREITYAIKHTERLKLWDEGFLEKIESIFNFILFEYVSLWGLSPGWPLILMGSGILIFSLPYIFALYKSTSDGIWKHWHKERSRQDLGEINPELLNLNLLNSIRYGLYFSLLSAFHFGWRDLNVGNWIMRIQPHEYSLRATGWVRTVSGVQSLISIYLLAMWMLTYFGRPFQ